MRDSMYQLTNSWFLDGAKDVWDCLIPQLNPSKILEIGSFEGACICYLIEKLAHKHALEIHSIDTWDGSIEHKGEGFEAAIMSDVESRFKANISIAQENAQNIVHMHIHKGSSHQKLAGLMNDGYENYFDLIYVDGSHQAPDVILDAVLGFKLLRNGGVMIFDDYLWNEPMPNGVDPLRSPKIAIDAFTNIYSRKISILRLPLHQIYIQKDSN